MANYTIDTLRGIYFTNQPYRYPLPWYRKKQATGVDTEAAGFLPTVNTGWHIIPNMLWGHVCSPRQWWEMMIKFEAISVTGITCRIFNPIPIQTALSFQANSTFPAFNNTVYALGYTDDLYETPWFPWHGYPYSGTTPMPIFYEYNPAYKEGLIPKKRSDIYTAANDVAENQEQLFTQEHRFPAFYPSKVTQTDPGSYQAQDEKYRRMFLPIYWYHHHYCQYKKTGTVGQSWRDMMSQFEEAWLDPSGAFWDPLNRPHELKELRPGKNMIEYSWHIHPSDEGIWFNTDRVAYPTPYPRPRPLQGPSGAFNQVGEHRTVDPLGPSVTVDRTRFLVEMGLLQQGSDPTTSSDMMCPEQHVGNPNWRDFPVVPTRWFLKEMQQSHPYTYINVTKYYYKGTPSNCPNPATEHVSGITKGDVSITAPMEDVKFPGTEYEMVKYPPTQWFLKAIPLFDDAENHIAVEMQAFMHITINVIGKERRSALYAPSWGPIPSVDLYSVNMDTAFGENYMRGRSGGARRTWYNPAETRPYRSMDVRDIELFESDGDTTNKQPKYPNHATNQCIVEPQTSAVEPPENPIVAGYAKSTQARGIFVTLNADTNERCVKIKRGNKCE